MSIYFVSLQEYDDARSLERFENDLATMRIENICAQVYELEDGANEAAKLVEGFETQLAAVREKIAEQMAHVRCPNQAHSIPIISALACGFVFRAC